MKQLFILITSISACNAIFTESSQETQALHSYAWANYLHYGQNHKEAASWYENALATSTSRYKYKGYIVFLFEQRQYTKIVSLIEKLDTTFAKDPAIQQLFAQALYKTGHEQEAIKRLLMLNQQFKNDPEIAFQAVQIYMKKKEPQNAILVIDAFLNQSTRRATDCIFYFLKAQCHLFISEYDAARDAVKKSVELQSQFDKGWLLLALLEEQSGRIDEAIKGYNHFLEVTAMPKQAIQERVFQLALLQHKKAVNSPLHPTEWFRKAKESFEKHDYIKAEQLLLKTTPAAAEQPIDYHLLHIQIMLGLNRFDDALLLIKQEAQKESSSNPSWLKMLHLFSHQIPAQSIFDTFNALEKKYNKNHWFYLYQADIHIRLNNKDLALEKLEIALNLVKKPSLKAKILFQKGVLYFEKRMFKEMITSLENAQQLLPNYPPLLNLIAYYYATKGHDLSKAETFIKQALALDSTNPHILDTQAVILYKQRDYVQANNILTQIRNQETHDATILIHHAKTLCALHKKDESLEALNQARLHARYEHEFRSLRKSQQKWQQKYGSLQAFQEDTSSPA